MKVTIPYRFLLNSILGLMKVNEVRIGNWVLISIDAKSQDIESVPRKIMGITVNESFIFFKPDLREFITVPAILCSGIILGCFLSN